MSKTKIINKGYTLSVTSWENDGDNYKTESITLDSKDLAVAVARMCRDLFKSKNSRDSSKSIGIGNSMSSRESGVQNRIIEYMKEHPELYPSQKDPKDEKLIDICMEYNSNLMGYSEYYYSRVFSSATLTYSPEDVYLETIEF